MKPSTPFIRKKLAINLWSESAPWFQEIIDYCGKVIKGEKLAAKTEIAACQRFVDDYEQYKTDDQYQYRFDFSKAWKVISFIENLPHVKGHFASQIGKNKLIQLGPWQKFIIANIFGWVVKKTALRRYSLVYLRIPRKNGKSTLAAGIGLYMLCADGEAGAEVLCGATTLEQAKKVYTPALQMLRDTPALKKAYNLDGKEQSIKRLDGSIMHALIGDPGDGGNPSCAIVDEYHEHDNDNLYQCMITGMAARLQPLMLVITTSGKNLFSPCYDMDKTARDMLDGTIDMPHMFAVCFGIDDDDDWTNPAMLIKANPNFGVSVGADFVEKQLKTAIQKPGYQVDYKTKHLNIWCNEKNAFYNVLAWQRLHDQELKLEDFLGQPCWIGLDMAKKRDLSAKILLFTRRIDGRAHYYVFSKFYIAESQIIDNESKVLSSMFQRWHDQGFLDVCEGNEHDFNRIKNDIIEDSYNFSVEEVAHDPWGAVHIRSDLVAAGMLPVEITQHGSHLTIPVNELEVAIDSGRIHHDGNPVMAWCIGNVIIHEYKSERKMPDKQDNDSKIDGASALFNAMARCVVPDDNPAINVGCEFW